MKTIVFLLLAFAWISCSEDSVASPKYARSDKPFGWMDAGFTPDPTTLNTRGGGLQKVAHSGDWIVLMDSWTRPVDNMPGYSTYSPRIFISRIGTDSWDTLHVPSGEDVKTLHADSFGIYVGTYATGEVWKYSPDKKEWMNMEPRKLSGKEGYTVFGISPFQSRLIVSMSGYSDSLEQVYDSIKVHLLWQGDTGWVDVTPANFEDALKAQFHKGVERNGKLYLATGLGGVKVFDPSSQKWESMPLTYSRENSIGMVESEVWDIAVHRGNLYVVDSDSPNRVYMWDDLQGRWNAVDSAYAKSISESSLTSNLPPTIYSIVSSGDHLFLSGKYRFPKVYMGDYGEPYGEIPKGWRAVGDMCAGGICLAGGGARSLDVIGDTLYVAAWERLVKFPLDLLDSAISGETDFEFW